MRLHKPALFVGPDPRGQLCQPARPRLHACGRGAARHLRHIRQPYRPRPAGLWRGRLAGAGGEHIMNRVAKCLAIGICVLGASTATERRAEAAPQQFGSNYYELILVAQPFTGISQATTTLGRQPALPRPPACFSASTAISRRLRRRRRTTFSLVWSPVPSPGSPGPGSAGTIGSGWLGRRRVRVSAISATRIGEESSLTTPGRCT